MTCWPSENNRRPLWELKSTEKVNLDPWPILGFMLYDIRTVIYDTQDNNMKTIQRAALFVIALNCGIIGYWFGKYQPIFMDFLTNHGAKNTDGKRNGKPRIQISFAKNIGFNRFIILVSFLSKIIIPFFDSITGKSK